MASAMFLLVLVTTLPYWTTAVTKQDDLIQNLPGLTFQPNFKQYSGYLDASQGNHLHYWLVESQNSPSWDPLILWLNGGPGCSSLGGFFTELGPFHPTADGKNLVENVNSWNRFANVLFLESPRDIGFSYRDTSMYGNDTMYNDDKTAADNALALKSFFDRFTEYKGRPFFITGESYGGVYVPTLTDTVIKMIQNGSLPNVNLAGMAVGNGELSAYQQLNSAIDLLYYRGMLGMQEYSQLQPCCMNQGTPISYCSFDKYVSIDDFGNINPINSTNDPLAQKCSTLVSHYSQDLVWNTYNDVYNSYQDCYNFTSSGSDAQKAAKRAAWKTVMGSKTLRAAAGSSKAFATAAPAAAANPFKDQGSTFNAGSTDSAQGFQCYMDTANEIYLNLPEVRKALHIPDGVQYWVDCNIPVNEQFYHRQNNDMTPVFQSILRSNYPLNMLIYNGDVDMACNYQGDEWFIENLVKQTNMVTVAPRGQWTYTRPGFDPVVAGYIKQFTYSKTAVINLLTVKGAGHFVPVDRPAPSLQMITNFIFGRTFNTTLQFNNTPKPLLPQFAAPPQPSWTRKQADRVWNLPGVTFNFNFKQYSGYLSGVPGNSLHYWFVESQSNPQNDPLVLWLNGGPGCSSLMGFLSELGPFHPNSDGKSLFENIYSWNKGANVLFLESPRGVGFSIQNTSINNDTVYDDHKTAYDSFLALKDFFTVYPEYVGRDFYVTGESYGGVYVPTLTSLLIDEIQAGNFPELHLVGMAVGNGELSALKQINSAIHLLYFHGLYGKQEWDQLQQCCNASTTDPKWFEYCDFSQYIRLDSAGNAWPRDNGVCGRLVASMGQERVWDTINDVYNIYQDCYQQNTSVFGSRSVMSHKTAYKKAMFAASFVDQGAKVSLSSTDSQGGFQCYASDAASNYLNSADVRAALHISPLAGNWSSCNDDINANYIQQHNDTGHVFDHIVESRYPLRMMIYNGDVDMACNFIGDQWFVEAVADRWGMTTANNFSAWRYMYQIAGYAKKFTYGTGSIDLVTVKGAGHLVPSDRPGPALQMITNFIRQQDFSSPIPYNTQITPLTETFKIAKRLSDNVAYVNGTYSGSSSSSTSTNTKKSYGRGRLGLRRRSILKSRGLLNKEETKRVKREMFDAPPPPPTGSKDDDLITNLPGLTFTPNYKQYSGFLAASAGNYLHYWLVESQGNPATDPLILWLNGGPGCSSIGGLLEELGPFHVNQDGQTLFENVFAWNKVGNVLFLEAPRGVGYSYRSNEVGPDTVYNDTYTANDNALALASFFARFPDYRKRDFYITGESYGGVYVPTLTRALIQRIQDQSMSYVNLKGVAIGNGELSAPQQINSAIPLLYFRGEHGKSDWDALSKCCNGSQGPQTYCDFMSYITLDSSGNAWPKYNDGSLAAQCGQLAVQQGFLDVWTTDNDVYNTFADCYSTTPLSDGGNRRSKRSAFPPLMNKKPYVDQAQQINYMSTDANQGFTCFSGDSSQSYMNLPFVRQALHIPDGLPYWTDCNDGINENYNQMYHDTTSVFQDILASGYKVKFLIYNGDVDMACQFLGDEWFIEKLAASNQMSSTTRSSWNYTQQSFLPRIGGYYKTFNYKNSQVTFDLLTVKGAGHFVPQDRPGPALQMISNFVGGKSYSSPLSLNINRQPLIPAYTPAPPPSIFRPLADKIFALPGVTFTPQFNQHSGYLKSSPGNYLHYWFVESQNDPSNDPVLLWLTGGPGCSSLGALLAENGPFHPNPDGSTLFENVYSWNKGASVLYIESPRGVGFSYQDKSVNNDTTWDDTKTAADLSLAVADFFANYQHFASNPFYVTGESYGGVYVPTLTRQLIKDIQNGRLSANLKGMAIGNGMISVIQDVRSLPDFLYYHGLYGKQEWDSLRACCPSGPVNQTMMYCNYDYYVTMDKHGNLVPNKYADQFSNDCAAKVVSMAQDRNWNSGYDVYNLYQDCYTTGNGVFVLGADKKKIKSKSEITSSKFNFRKELASMMSQSQSASSPVNPSIFDPISTDNFGAFQCFMTDASSRYLNLPHVRDALHVPDFVQPWQFCSDIHYHLEYNDTTPVFQDILNSGYNLSVLIYNGDVDTACGMFEAQYMIENFASVNGFKTSNARSPWMYGNQIAGYSKQFQSTNGSMSIQLTTVKGAGHMVPTDRPGPSLQLINNFIYNSDVNTPIQFDLTRQPLLPQFMETGAGPVPSPLSGASTAMPPPTVNVPTMKPITPSSSTPSTLKTTSTPSTPSTTPSTQPPTTTSTTLPIVVTNAQTTVNVVPVTTTQVPPPTTTRSAMSLSVVSLVMLRLFAF